MKISSILAAVDFSDDARHAAVRAGLLAATHGAQLTLLHVINSSSLAVLHRLRRASSDESRVIGHSRQALDTIARELKDRSNGTARIVVKVGLVMEEILSSSAQADLLVLGAHG